MNRAFLPDLTEMVEAARPLLEKVDYDTMVGTGLSGALVVPFLSRAFGKYWAIVRKPNDGSHSITQVEGQIEQRWIFVEDTVETERTRQRVQNVISEISPLCADKTTFVGTFVYQSPGWYERKTTDYSDINGQSGTYPSTGIKNRQ